MLSRLSRPVSVSSQYLSVTRFCTHPIVCTIRHGGADPAFFLLVRASNAPTARLRGAFGVAGVWPMPFVLTVSAVAGHQPAMAHPPRTHGDPRPAPLFIGIQPLALAKRRVCEITALQQHRQCRTQHCPVVYQQTYARVRQCNVTFSGSAGRRQKCLKTLVLPRHGFGAGNPS